jgi:hypothetical protein
MAIVCPHPTNRVGYLHSGVLTEFRLNTDDSLVWEACTFWRTEVDDVVPHAVGDGALSDYTVTAVEVRYRQYEVDDDQGDPQDVGVALCYPYPVVTVKVGL